MRSRRYRRSNDVVDQVCQSPFQPGVKVIPILNMRRFVQLDNVLEKMQLIDVELNIFTAMWLNWLQAGVGPDRIFLMIAGPDARGKSKGVRRISLDLTQNLYV